jgi:hypothetical protein
MRPKDLSVSFPSLPLYQALIVIVAFRKRSRRISSSWKIIQDDPTKSRILESYKPTDAIDPQRQISENRPGEFSFPDNSSGVAGALGLSVGHA